MVLLFAVRQPRIRPFALGESAHEGVGDGECGARLLRLVVKGVGACADGGRQRRRGGRPGADGGPGLIGEAAGGCLGQARRTIAGAAATDPDAFFDNPQLVTDIRMNSYFKALSDGRVKDAVGAWPTCM
ncbi:hypothetical protein [Streptomyces mirabilis]|uniref:hypothetical protein n=1 Tax=Streptomyces mirabilis TaxID=68239 RepID=UPI00224E3E23|nr:hypothetical protein [Streptomyces mirabilis]MCX4419339.1 hypothetical protein [Streptomyces mirabilis]